MAAIPDGWIDQSLTEPRRHRIRRLRGTWNPPPEERIRTRLARPALENVRVRQGVAKVYSMKSKVYMFQSRTLTNLNSFRDLGLVGQAQVNILHEGNPVVKKEILVWSRIPRAPASPLVHHGGAGLPIWSPRGRADARSGLAQWPSSRTRMRLGINCRSHKFVRCGGVETGAIMYLTEFPHDPTFNLNWQDPYRPRSRSGGLPKGALRRLPHGRCPGS